MRSRGWRIVGFSLPALCVAVFAGGELYRRRDFSGMLTGMRGGPAASETVLERRDAEHEYHTVHLLSETGISVAASLKTPAGGRRAHPALVVLGGLRTGRRTVEYLDGTRGLVLLCMDYPYEGKHEKLSPWEFVRALPGIRRAILETVPAVMLGVDYLLSREDVDPDRIVLAGGSLGALFVPAVAALDERIAAAAILFGAGDIERLARANINAPAILAAPAAWACAVLAAPLEPLDYVAGISPRPLFMLSATGDPRMPLACSRALHEAAGEPKTIRWIDAGHVSVHDPEFHELVGRELQGWLETIYAPRESVRLDRVPRSKIE